MKIGPRFDLAGCLASNSTECRRLRIPAEREEGRDSNFLPVSGGGVLARELLPNKIQDGEDIGLRATHR